MKKKEFKLYIKKKTRQLALIDLEIIKNTHSKVKDIKYRKLETQSYIKNGGFNTEEIQFLYRLRTRMMDVKQNFKNMYDNNLCRLCQNDEETQQHLLECEKLLQNCPPLYNDMLVKYEDIFSSNVKKQLRATKLFQSVWKVWDNMANEN